MKHILCNTPNKHAQAPGIVINANTIDVKGYNSYSIENAKLVPARHNTKFNFISKYLNKLENKTVLDLGCANGLFSIYSALNKSKLVTSVDIDESHLNIIKSVSNELNLTNMNISNTNVENINSTHDIVLALALIHWVYSCTSVKFGSLDKVIKWLSELTNDYLIIEWIDAKNDTNVNWFKHTEYNADLIEDEYTKENFDKALNTYFSEVVHIGDTNKFRKIYIAYK